MKRNPVLLAAALAAGLQACSEPPAQHELDATLRQPLQGLTRVKDINPRPERFPDYPRSGSGDAFTTSGGVTFLPLYDWLTGTELWTTDGTEAGTRLVKDIAPGLFSSYPQQLAEFQGTVYFSAKSDFLEVALWKTDGTEAGTVPVKRFSGVLDEGAALSALTTVGNRVLFMYEGQLWRSDGTEAGTVPLKAQSSGSEDYDDPQLVNQGGAVYFTVKDAVEGVELWKTDGTEAGTTRVRDLVPGELNTSAPVLQAAGDALYFMPSWQGNALWRTDGTAAGTVRVNTQPGFITSQLAALPDGLLFVQQGRLWRTRGTSVEALTSANPASIQELVSVGGTAFFSTSPSDGSAPELWKTDGTVQGTVPVGDLWPGAGQGDPVGLRTWHGELLFTATTATGRRGLWRTNGTPAGTTVLKDWPESSSGPFTGSNSTPITAGASLLFVVPDAEGWPEVWRSDGTAAGSRALAPLTSRTGTSQVAQYPLGVLPGAVLFLADDGTGGQDLWKSDGTEAGTVPVKRFVAEAFQSYSETVVMGSTLFFTLDDRVHGRELWKSDGTEAGTVMVKDLWAGAAPSSPEDFAVVGGTLFFAAMDGVHGRELWKSDGTEAGTQLVRDLTPTVGDSTFPAQLTVVNGTLYFTAESQGEPRAIWKTDGTEAGTVRALSRDPEQLIAGGTTFFFRTPDQTLWSSDGTEAGTLQLCSQCEGMGFERWLNGRLYFTVLDSAHGLEPWVSDGTPAGTHLLADLNPGAAYSYAGGFTRLGTHVLFAADDGVHGLELWRTDGTEAGTVRLTDSRQNRSGLFPAYLAEGGAYAANRLDMLVLEDRGLALFAGLDEQGGVEPWVTDGTPEGTRRWLDAEPGAGSSTPLGFARVGGFAVFFAGDSAVGRELFRMPLPELTPPVLTCPANVTVSTEAAEGTRVEYPAATATATLGTPVLNYSQASGTVFAVGTHGVTVSATDSGGRQSQCTFSVTVNRQATQEPEPSPVESKSGCGCASGSAGTSAAGGLLMLGLTAMRRLNRGTEAP